MPMAALGTTARADADNSLTLSSMGKISGSPSVTRLRGSPAWRCMPPRWHGPRRATVRRCRESSAMTCGRRRATRSSKPSGIWAMFWIGMGMSGIGMVGEMTRKVMNR